MAKTSNFGFTNETAATLEIFDLKSTTNYDIVKDEPTYCRTINKTAPYMHDEIVEYRNESINSFTVNADVAYPDPVPRKSVRYGVRVDEILRTTTTDGAGIETSVDNPIVVSISISHQKSENVSESMVEEALRRAVSAFYKSDGSSRISALQRSALKPTVD